MLTRVATTDIYVVPLNIETGKDMTAFNQERIDFMYRLHEAFVKRKGHGALAYVSILEIKDLFDTYQDSNQPADIVINQFVRSVLDSNL